MKKRSCGECDACCDHVAVHALNKPAQTLCPLLQAYDGRGCCSNYQCRPSECKAYTCSWIDGDLPSGWRPDRCGILFESGRIEWPRTITVVTGFELEPGAIDAQRHLLKRIFGAGVVAIIVPHQLVGEMHEGSMPVRVGADGGAEPEWFGAHADIHDVKAFFALCRMHGGLTIRMIDRDVAVPMR